MKNTYSSTGSEKCTSGLPLNDTEFIIMKRNRTDTLSSPIEGCSEGLDAFRFFLKHVFDVSTLMEGVGNSQIPVGVHIF